MEEIKKEFNKLNGAEYYYNSISQIAPITMKQAEEIYQCFYDTKQEFTKNGKDNAEREINKYINKWSQDLNIDKACESYLLSVVGYVVGHMKNLDVLNDDDVERIINSFCKGLENRNNKGTATVKVSIRLQDEKDEKKFDDNNYEFYKDTDGDYYLQKDSFTIMTYNQIKDKWVNINPYPSPIVGNTIRYLDMYKLLKGNIPTISYLLGDDTRPDKRIDYRFEKSEN